MRNESNSTAEDLEQRLRRVEEAKTGCYEKRTHYKDGEGKTRFINRLILEDSPYLLQHAHNPVNWYAWGAEAFDAARAEDKPVFLSIGYSTCHWCHVMEAESFDNIEIARILNQDFICIKLDREQYPDIDEIYMTGVQIISGQGGWPMSNFLMPDGNPFYSATYFPPAQFSAVLNQITTIWQDKKSELARSAKEIANTIEQILQGRKEVKTLDLKTLENAVDRMLQREDRTNGGLAGAPKFPQEPLLLYFLEAAIRRHHVPAMDFSVRALEAMGRGGIYDQVAGGFHRYSTDAEWLVPHFEKMLYNQSQLGRAYLVAWRLTGTRFFDRIVRQTLDYVLREMQPAEGGFYSATDADSEDVEGLYFIWTLEELRRILTEPELALCLQCYDLTEAGNFEDANILALTRGLSQLAGDESFESYAARLDAVLLKLRRVREQRIPPLRDDKLIVAWAAAMATTLARAGHELGDSTYLEAAEKAVGFIWQHNVVGQQSLQRIYLNGVVSIAGQLEDYANLAEALITLFDVTQKTQYLLNAASLMTDAIKLFWNDESGGFYLSQPLEQGPKLTRSSSANDSATLSAYGVALDVLVALSRRRAALGESGLLNAMDYTDRINKSINAVSGALDENPLSHTSVIRALNHHRDGSTELIQFVGEGLLRVEVSKVGLPDSVEPGGLRRIEFSLALMPGYAITGLDKFDRVQDRTGNLSADRGPDANARTPLALTLQEAESAWELGEIAWRPALATANASHSPYRESFVLEVSVRRMASRADALAESVGLQLSVQLCSDMLCLRTETLYFRI